VVRKITAHEAINKTFLLKFNKCRCADFDPAPAAAAASNSDDGLENLRFRLPVEDQLRHAVAVDVELGNVAERDVVGRLRVELIVGSSRRWNAPKLWRSLGGFWYR
jgi:hypothetical protein